VQWIVQGWPAADLQAGLVVQAAAVTMHVMRLVRLHSALLQAVQLYLAAPRHQNIP
jgi:hypothetical protein